MPLPARLRTVAGPGRKAGRDAIATHVASHDPAARRLRCPQGPIKEWTILAGHCPWPDRYDRRGAGRPPPARVTLPQPAGRPLGPIRNP